MIKDLGNKLKSLRLNNKLSRKQLAELIGVTESMIGLYETGERTPSVPALIKLAMQYSVSIDYLLDCEIETHDILSLDGLTDEQKKSLRMVVNCYRNLNR